MRHSIRILHTSDVHIGAFDGPGSRDPGKCLRAFASVVDHALDAAVDLVLVAGDLFDHHRVSDSLVGAVGAELEKLTMPAVLLPGNHDPLIDRSAYARMVVPDHVHLIAEPDGQTVVFEDLGLAVWGRPHMTYEHDVRPLAAPPPSGDEPWQVALAHGHFVRGPEDLMRSYLIHDEEIAACDRHYVALGHWDLHQPVGSGAVPAYYPGSPTYQGTSSMVDLLAGESGRVVSVTPFVI